MPTYALRFGEDDTFIDYEANFEDMASLEAVIRQRQDVPLKAQLFWQASEADELLMEWDINMELPPLPWVTVEIPRQGSWLSILPA